MEQQKTAIFNLYERRDSLKQTIDQMKVENARNKEIIDILNATPEDKKKELDISGFIKSINESIDNFDKQQNALQKLYDHTETAIKYYEENKTNKKVVYIMNELLLSFGFESGEEEKKEK